MGLFTLWKAKKKKKKRSLNGEAIRKETYDAFGGRENNFGNDRARYVAGENMY
jgi:hypothetical protein